MDRFMPKPKKPETAWRSAYGLTPIPARSRHRRRRRRRRAGWAPPISRGPSRWRRAAHSDSREDLASGRFWICAMRWWRRRAVRRSVIVNDRADLARWPARPACTSARRICPRPTRAIARRRGDRWLLDAHVAQIERGLREPVSYLAVGPVFGTRTKETGYQRSAWRLVSDAARWPGRCRSSRSAASRSTTRRR